MEDDYIIGAEKSLREVFENIDLMPLIKSAVSAGASYVMVEDSEGEILYRHGGPVEEGVFTVKQPMYLEGEIAGHIVITGDYKNKGRIRAIGELIFNAVKIILNNSFKTMLAVETHTTVVNRSYEELLETNRKLMLSEGRYRDLANTLEKEVHERTEELKQAHAKLLHQEKIASIGQLAAGIAHEINNPIGFISSNINTLKQYVSKFRDMLFFYHSAFEKEGLSNEDREASKQKWKNLKLDFILPDVEDLVRESLEGAERVKKIVSDLKGFSHIDEADKAYIEINSEIDRTLNVLTHEIPEDAEIVRDYQDIPAFSGNPAHICQAFFNIILNAVQARKEGLKLVIAVRCLSNLIRIDFSDNGPGIPENIRKRIFDPFFTTKEVGTGTGMGLNVTYEIISSYGGTVEVESEAGKGTTFSILLPLPQKGDDAGVR
ncbi:MAG TPA: histidine kinase [Nitrospirae bacterium]|nr:C4-dicarboxylate transport sensor protein DctB [bacterium BMS3Abin06]HDH12158.1 histidine kinase [Nitrospirota bacterium]HDZ02139.1 histidine kinase [Nitrospirota bacterium]